MKILALLLLGSMGCLPGVAQDTTSRPTADPAIEAVKQVAYLTRYAAANIDALSFIQAARILAKTPIRIIPANEVAVSPADTSAGAMRLLFRFDSDTLLARGRQLAGADPLLLALADQVAGESAGRSRGRLNGPKTMAARVKAGSSFTATWTFKGGEVASISVIGDGDNDLDLQVLDAQGRMITQDNGHTDACEVHFTPSENAAYRLVVKNWGSSYSDFVLITN